MAACSCARRGADEPAPRPGGDSALDGPYGRNWTILGTMGVRLNTVGAMTQAFRRPVRLFFAEDLLSGRLNLNGYPFRYICVTSLGITNHFEGFTVAPRNYLAVLDVVLSAVEFLETQGWEVVTLDERGLLAFVRRRY